MIIVTVNIGWCSTYKDVAVSDVDVSVFVKKSIIVREMAFSITKALSRLAIGHTRGELTVAQLIGRGASLQPRGFLSSCVDWGTLRNEKNKMAAYCRTTTGTWRWSVLDLNHCLVNDDGNLMAQDHTEAEAGGGHTADHGIDLNDVVGNDSGVLFCGRQGFHGNVVNTEQVSWWGFDIVIRELST
ncbi:Putative cyanovirin-N [Colletotrichum destructivum]|uniref:Cyanovirin-N n=1 Tax=Colletotrichum destructivum TaxID=34406 RepID=A0AAX4I1L9_9PEZI|nr:Putative cyanovirin-N [Colletotrichum destructivum]